MPVSLIAVDVDGTLINSDGRVTERTKAAFRDAYAAGIRLALATGRARDECRGILRELPEVRYMVNCSGASVYDIDRGLELYADPIPIEDVRRFYRLLEPLGSMFEVFAEGRVLTDYRRLAELPEYHNHYYLEIIQSSRTPIDLPAFLESRTEPLSKIHLYFRCEADQLKARALVEGSGFLVLNSIKENLEINQPTVSKGVGLAELANALDIPLSEVMAIGDNTNDIGMLQTAGYAAVVGNGHPEAIRNAQYLLPSCDDDGVASAIRHILDGNLEALRKV